MSQSDSSQNDNTPFSAHRPDFAALSNYLAPCVKRWIRFVTGCLALLFIGLLIAVYTLQYRNPPQANAFEPYKNLIGQPISALGPCVDPLGPCDDLTPRMAYHEQQIFTTRIRPSEGPIKSIEARGENGLITKLEFSCRGLEVSEAVAIWHRPNKIKANQDSTFLLLWDVGIELTTHPAARFDYHVPIANLVYAAVESDQPTP